jgi:hypothetical protein
VFEIKSAILTDWRDGSLRADIDSFRKSPITQVALGTNQRLAVPKPRESSCALTHDKQT